jgi:hypothetical protein
MASRVNHQEIVRKLLDAKAIDFANVAKVVAEVGPSLSLADEPWEGFCGTMRRFFHCYRLPDPGSVVENLEQLQALSGQLKAG